MYVEEAEWAIEVMKATGKPVAMCLNICSAGDFEGVPVEECAVRIAKAGKGERKTHSPSPQGTLHPEYDTQHDVIVTMVTRCSLFAGADIIGVNCFYDPDVCLKTMRDMKQGLDKAGLKCHLMVQPIGYRTPECTDNNPASKMGMTGLAEFPYGRTVTSRVAFS